MGSKCTGEMAAFQAYVDELKSLLCETIYHVRDNKSFAIIQKEIDQALDGGAGKSVRELVPIAKLRKAGAFFTGSELARFAIQTPTGKPALRCAIADPACGAGDLLIASAFRLPVGATVQKTLSIWGSRLSGRDLHPQFVDAAKLRLVLAAIHRSPRGECCTIPPLEELFTGIRASCGLDDHQFYSKASHIVLNPPFAPMQAPDDCEWATGLVNSAACFLETSARCARPGTHIHAILPEVLRCGSRYQKCRDVVSSYVDILSIDSWGLFDRRADIDVFVLHAKVRANHRRAPSNWDLPREPKPGKVEDFFEICVGPVVAFRDPKRGSELSFITPREVPPWAEVRRIGTRRKYRGRSFKPPFIVVRRTSRPGDKFRAIASIILGRRRVAVENHFLVLIPKDGTARCCRELLRHLKNPAVSAWLDKRMRCRHLTVSSIRELPYGGNRPKMANRLRRSLGD